jgi:hypothetical protein
VTLALSLAHARIGQAVALIILLGSAALGLAFARAKTKEDEPEPPFSRMHLAPLLFAAAALAVYLVLWWVAYLTPDGFLRRAGGDLAAPAR